MSNLKALLAKQAELDRLIAETRKTELSGAVAEARALIAEFGLAEADVFGNAKGVRKPTGKVAAKYRDPATGKEWTGRGKPPVWIAGKDRAPFEI